MTHEHSLCVSTYDETLAGEMSFWNLRAVRKREEHGKSSKHRSGVRETEEEEGDGRTCRACGGRGRSCGAEE